MKTRQEMIYDFMVALSANASVHSDWLEDQELLGSFSEHVEALAEELADRILGSIA